MPYVQVFCPLTLIPCNWPHPLGLQKVYCDVRKVGFVLPVYRGQYIVLPGIYVCVLHIKPVFLAVDIEHTQYPCPFFLFRDVFCQALWSQNHDKEIRSYRIVMQYIISSVHNEMACHIVYDSLRPEKIPCITLAQVSMYGNVERVLPFMSWHPRVKSF